MASASAAIAVKRALIKAGRRLGISIGSFDRAAHREFLRRQELATKFRPFTMVAEAAYIDNLELAGRVKGIPGDVVECGVWRGGMIAGIASILGPDRTYWLFDSFEGLPPAQEIDGAAAIAWQNDKQGQTYFDNCTAEEGFAKQAMQLSGTANVEFVKGWFTDTVGGARVTNIALLRLDGDWYDSTMTCLEAFYPRVADGGLIIIDDYYTWDGCARAVHDFLSRHALADRVHQTTTGIAFIVKNPVRSTQSTSATSNASRAAAADVENRANRADVVGVTLAASV